MKKISFDRAWLKQEYVPRFTLFCKNCKFFIENAWNVTEK